MYNVLSIIIHIKNIQKISYLLSLCYVKIFFFCNLKINIHIFIYKQWTSSEGSIKPCSVLTSSRISTAEKLKELNFCPFTGTRRFTETPPELTGISVFFYFIFSFLKCFVLVNCSLAPLKLFTLLVIKQTV